MQSVNAHSGDPELELLSLHWGQPLSLASPLPLLSPPSPPRGLISCGAVKSLSFWATEFGSTSVVMRPFVAYCSRLVKELLDVLNGRTYFSLSISFSDPTALSGERRALDPPGSESRGSSLFDARYFSP